MFIFENEGGRAGGKKKKMVIFSGLNKCITPK